MRPSRCDSSGRSSTSAMADVRVVAGDATRCVLKRRRRVCAARHEFGALPTTDSLWPSRGRGRGSPEGRVDGRSLGVSTVGSIGGGASRDAIARRCLVVRGPPPCASSSRFAVKQTKTAGRAPGGGGALVARFIALSCCRRARFSRTSSRSPRSPSASARPIDNQQLQHVAIVAGVGRQNQLGRVLARDRGWKT